MDNLEESKDVDWNFRGGIQTKVMLTTCNWTGGGRVSGPSAVRTVLFENRHRQHSGSDVPLVWQRFRSRNHRRFGPNWVMGGRGDATRTFGCSAYAFITAFSRSLIEVANDSVHNETIGRSLGRKSRNRQSHRNGSVAFSASMCGENPTGQRRLFIQKKAIR
jgi:hypothetical protein